MSTFAALALGALCLVVLVRWSPLSERLSERTEALRSGEFNELLSGRLDGWRVASRLFAERPFLGVGFGAFRREYTSTKEDLLAEGDKFYAPLAMQSSFGNVHNEGLEVLSETGLLGGLAVVWALFVISMRPGVKPHRHSGPTPVPLDFTRGALLALLVVSLGYFPFRLAVLAVPALLVLAAALRSEVPQEIQTSTPPLTAGRRRWGWRFAALGLALALLVQAQRTRTALLTERILISAQAEATMLASRTAPRRTERLARNLAALQRAFERRPFDERLPLAIGSYHLLAGRPQSAEEWYRKGLAIEVRPELLLNLGRALHQQGREDEAQAYLARLQKLEPHRRKAPSAALEVLEVLESERRD
jgi:hypothetical protein